MEYRPCTSFSITRREFLTGCSLSVAGVLVLGLPVSGCSEERGGGTSSGILEGRRGYIKPVVSPYFLSLDDNAVMCLLCPRGCVVSEGKRGYCEVRENRGGKYYSLVYGNPCAIHVDPIEKKPFFHVLPNTTSFSIATAGCNFTCKFCQNFDISQAVPENTINFALLPKDIPLEARSYLSQSVAYTYVEPTIFYEYMLDTVKEVKSAGLLNVMHSNGFINPGPRKELSRYMDAVNIDLKGFSDTFYSEMTEGKLEPVKNSISGYKKAGVHVEITNLVIPTLNDDPKMIGAMCEWIRDEVGKDTPLHFSRFHPMYKLMNIPPTPVETLEAARNVASQIGLEYVYIGNVPGHAAESTFCPRCKEMVIFRSGYFVGEVKLKRGACAFCGFPIPGIWKTPSRS